MVPSPIHARGTTSTEQPWIVGLDQPVLVTGAGGFIGARVVKVLLDYGFRRVRCFVRPSKRVDGLHKLGAKYPAAELQIIEGNLLSKADCERAVADVVVVYHLAAGADRSYAGCFMNSVLTTRNLLDQLVLSRAMRRFVNVSSFSVYSNWTLPLGAVIDESAPIESQYHERQDPYGYAKIKQDALVQRYHQDYGLPYVIIRPGAVFGPGKSALSGRIGIDTFGIFLHLGGANRVPWTFVDNCAEAICRAGLIAGVDGEVFNVVDDDRPTSRYFLKSYKRGAGWFWSVPVPYWAMYGFSAVWEHYSRWSRGQLPSRFNRRRAVAEWRRHGYSNTKLKNLLDWRPRVSFEEAMRVYVDSFRN